MREEKIHWLSNQIKSFLNDLEDYSDPFELEDKVTHKEALNNFLNYVKNI